MAAPVPPAPAPPVPLRLVGGASASVRAALARVPVRPTPAGVLALLVTAAAAGVQHVLGWAEAGALAAGLGAVLLVAVLGVLGHPPYEVTLAMGEARTVVGGRALGAVRVRNRARRRCAPHRLLLAAGSGSAALAVPTLGPGATWEELLVVPAARRGRVLVGPVRSQRGETLGLVRRAVAWAAPVEVLVHPATLPLPAGRSGLLRDLEGAADRAVADLSLSFHALREYVPGDDRRAIHWRSSARLGTLVVRQDEDVRRTRVALLLADEPAAWADAAEVETGIGVLASLALAAMAEGREVTVLAGARRLPTTTRTALLDACARLEAPVPADLAAATTTATGSPVPGDPAARPVGPLEGTLRRARRHGAGASLVVLVTGSAPDAHALVRAAHAVPDGARAVVLACGGPPGRRGTGATRSTTPSTTPSATPAPAPGHRAVLRVPHLADLPAAARAGAA